MVKLLVRLFLKWKQGFEIFLQSWWMAMGMEVRLRLSSPPCVFECTNAAMWVVRGTIAGKQAVLHCCDGHKKDLETTGASWVKNHLFLEHGMMNWKIEEFVLD